MIIKNLLVAFLVLFFFGCQTASQNQNSKKETENVEEVLTAVVGALIGKTLSEKEIHTLKKQIRSDEEAQSAIQAIADSVGRKATHVKYCPVTGKRYSSQLEICPEHQVKLEAVSP